MARPPRRVVLASCAALPTADGDDDDLPGALAARGLDVRWSPWDDPGAADADLVVLRATWDYTERLAEFLAWCDRVPRLANPPALVRWSTDKAYLLDLAAAGVATVPTTRSAPGEPVRLPAGAPEVVVKPAVGAGSRGAARFVDPAAARAHAAALHARGLPVLVQPFLPVVDAEGETALVLVRGEPSHAFTKGAMLAAPGAGTGATDGSGLFLTETLGPAAPPARAWALARAALEVAAARAGLRPADVLQARVDVLGADEPRVLELELVEPSLGWRQVAEPARAAALASFADAVAALASAPT
ncbi:hypothetical protein GCM10027047_24520 [Rhodococcus aerolatus]